MARDCMSAPIWVRPVGHLRLTGYLILIQTFSDNSKKNVTFMLYICIDSPPKSSDLGQDWRFILQWQHLPTNIACPIFFWGYWSVINRTYKCKLRPHRGTLFSNTYTKLFQILLSSSSKRLLSLPNNVWRLIVFALFLTIIKSPKQSYYYSYSFFPRSMNLSTADFRNYWTEFHETWWSYRYMFLVGPKGVQRGWGLL